MISSDVSISRPPIHLAAWLHHAFTAIHPFLDGNGRVARARATLVLLKANLLPFTVHRNMRTAYIQALKQADQGKHDPLYQFFKSCQFRKAVALLRACRFDALSVDSNLPLADLSAQIAANLRAKQQLVPQAWERTADMRGHLFTLAGEYLTKQLTALLPQFARDLGHTNESAGFTSANTLEGWPLNLEPQSLTALVLQPSNTFITFDPILAGREGISAVTATIKVGERFERLTPPFFFHFHTQDPEAAFPAWLDRALKSALLRWFDLQR